MNYILIGLLLSIGWHIVKLFYLAFEEMLYIRLHDTKWYPILCGKKKKTVKKANKNKIGFE